MAIVVGLMASGCPFAPGPVSGLAQGEACTGDLDCEGGLACECGRCEAVGETDDPVTCTANPDGACPATPSDCYSECGDIESVIGTAFCTFGRERCEVGETFDGCGPTICWDDPAPGEVCLNGEYICENGRSQATDLCYTNDCLGPAGECVNSCNDGFVFEEQCLAGEYQCEIGVPIADCGNCIGDPPGCVLSCLEPPVASAFCTDGEWDCSFVQGAMTDETCGPQDAGPGDAGPFDAGLDGGFDGGFDAGLDDDGGPVDAGALDGGEVDAGVVDAGAVDAGIVDAGALDAGLPDAGEVDAGPGPPAALAFADAPISSPVDACSGAVNFNIVDDNGSASAVSQATLVNVSEERSSVEIYSDAACSTAATVVLVQPGASTGFFYFQGSAALTFGVVISSTGLTSANETFTITP